MAVNAGGVVGALGGAALAWMLADYDVLRGKYGRKYRPLGAAAGAIAGYLIGDRLGDSLPGEYVDYDLWPGLKLTVPAGKSAQFIAPPGARDWAFASLTRPGQPPAGVPVPAAGAPFAVVSGPYGSVLTFAWHDAQGNTQMAQVTFI